MQNQVLEQFESALATWRDERFLTREDLRAVAMFSMYLVNLAEDDGWQYNGHSVKSTGYSCLLVVKATKDEIPQVVFVSAQTYAGSVRTFLRLLDEGLLEWRADRFRK